MAAAALKVTLKILECPVCLDVCTDPRMLPCPQGSHKLCKRCLNGLVRGSSITCPECRAKHNVPPSGLDGFHRDMTAVQMIDSLCRECRMAHQDVTCSHCDKMLCGSCHVEHQAFDAVKHSVDKLHVVIQKGGIYVKEAEIKRLFTAIEHEIDQTMNQLTNQLEDRRKTLKAELWKMIKEHMDSLSTWRNEMDRKTLEAQTYLDTANRELGDEYSDQITNQQMTDITSQSQHKIKDIESAMSKAPSLPKPVLKYNSQQAVSTISSFGSIELLPMDTEDCPVAVDTGPLTHDRPTAVGKKKSGPGGFQRPYDVAVCPVTGHVVVAEPGNSRVQVLDGAFKHIFDINTCGPRRDLQRPCRVAVNKSGEIIVSDIRSNAVYIYSQTGLYSRQLPGPWDKPRGIAVDSDDTIYVCDSGSCTIKVLSRAGKIIKTLGGPEQFQKQPLFITVYKGGNIVVSDWAGKIYQLTKFGSYFRKIDVDKVCEARGLTVTPANDLVIADGQGHIAVVRGEQTVSVIGEQGSEPWQLHNPLGMAVSKTGQIIVANYDNNNLLVYDMVRKVYP